MNPESMNHLIDALEADDIQEAKKHLEKLSTDELYEVVKLIAKKRGVVS